MTNHGSFFSIITGAFCGALNAVLSISSVNGIEMLKVFGFGIIGGIGGWVGRLIIQQIIKKTKNITL